MLERCKFSFLFFFFIQNVAKHNTLAKMYLSKSKMTMLKKIHKNVCIYSFMSKCNELLPPLLNVVHITVTETEKMRLFECKTTGVEKGEV